MSVVNYIQKMSYDTQKRIKEENRTKIRLELRDSPKRFKDLLKSTGFSPTGLTKILKEMVSENKIQKTLHEGKEAYSLSKKQLRDFDDFFNVAHTINSIISKGGKQHHDYSQLQTSMLFIEFPWGIESSIIVDKNLQKINPIRIEDVSKIEETLFQLIRDNAYNGKIKLDRNKQGKIVLCFDVDYSKLIESLDENSLEYYHNMEKREWKFLEKIGNEPETMTDKEWKQWRELRQKTLRKIKRGDKK